MNRSMGQCIGIFLTTLILGAFICYGYEKWPDGIFAFCAPQNTSVWELSKIAIWPCVLAIFLWHTRRWEKGSICAYLLVPAALPVALLFVYWFLHMVCGICSPILDTVIWILMLITGYLTATVLGDTAFAKQALPMVCMLVFVWICMYTIFSVFPADLPIFIDTIS